MSAVLGSQASAHLARWQPLRHVWRAWCSLQRRELMWFLWFGGLIGGMNLLALADGSVGGRNTALLLTETLMPSLSALCLLLVWLPADRSSAASPLRVQRLVSAVLVASLVTALLLPALVDWLDLPTVMEAAYREKNKPPPGWAACFVAEFLSMLMPSSLAVGVIEMARRHHRAEQAMASVLHEHAAMARSALESRLAAMQAQVEPQFLFDVLVDIERLYGTVPGSDLAGQGRNAVAQMDRLITYLRVALPRLRESGSSLGAEVDLLASYLDLVQALRGGRPSFHAELPDALRGATFHPMLLLPLVQRAVRSDDAPPDKITLRAEQQGGSLTLVLSLAAPGLCEDDAELQRLRERLQVLYGGHASLRCEETADGPDAATSGVLRSTLRSTRFTLSLPGQVNPADGLA